MMDSNETKQRKITRVKSLNNFRDLKNSEGVDKFVSSYQVTSTNIKNIDNRRTQIYKK